MLDGSRPRIVIVEDNERTRLGFKRHLSKIAEVREAERVDEVFEELLNGVDLVILDIRLEREKVYDPRWAGVQILERIRRQRPPFGEIPVIVVTAVISAEVEARCRELGVVEFLSKPVGVETLLHTVECTLERQKQQDRIKVFVSSTMRDLGEERETVRRAIRELGTCYWAELAEDWPPRPGSPRQICHEAIRACDIFLLIVGDRFGEPIAEGISATEDEYDLACRLSKPILVFAKRTRKREARAQAFLTKVGNFEKGHWIAEFRSPGQLYSEVQKAIVRMANENAE